MLIGEKCDLAYALWGLTNSQPRRPGQAEKITGQGFFFEEARRAIAFD